MIQLKDVSLILGATKIIEEISFKVEKGEFVFLHGPSGAGKSSILKLIHFDLLPTIGSVIVQGEDTQKACGVADDHAEDQETK